jgi:hypothetical protein
MGFLVGYSCSYASALANGSVHSILRHHLCCHSDHVTLWGPRAVTIIAFDHIDTTTKQLEREDSIIIAVSYVLVPWHARSHSLALQQVK